MTTFPGSPRLLKGGIVLMDATTGAVQRIIALQYSSGRLTRTLQVKGIGAETRGHIEATQSAQAVYGGIR
jgi:hypothetical protein